LFDKGVFGYAELAFDCVDFHMFILLWLNPPPRLYGGIKPFGLLGDLFVLRSVIATAQPEVIAPQNKI
jgi:hypothetical protein